MATGKTNTRHFRMWINEYELAAVTQQLNAVGVTYGETNVTAWNDRIMNYTLGHPRAVIDGYQAVFDNSESASTGTGGSFAALKTLDEDSNITIAMGIRGFIDEGDPVFFAAAQAAEYTITGQDGVLVTARFPHSTTQSDQNAFWGLALARRIAGGVTSTTVFDVVDMGAASANGILLPLHVYGTVSGNFSFVVHQSATGAFGGEETVLHTYALDGSAIGFELADVATAAQYLRLTATRTGGAVAIACAAIPQRA